MRWILPFLILGACGGARTPLLPVHDEVAVEARPDLHRRLTSDLYAFFRFTNRALGERICQRFAEVQSVMPEVNLHGDAHIEQYAITRDGEGLADYDDAAEGPAIMDLVRFGISLRLVGHLEGWSTDGAIDAFLEGYRWGLEHTEASPRAPAVCSQVRNNLGGGRATFFGVRRRNDGARRTGARSGISGRVCTLRGDDSRTAAGPERELL
ncbi:MAG: DUF2252 family protein [Myxococcota bacterium]